MSIFKKNHDKKQLHKTSPSNKNTNNTRAHNTSYNTIIIGAGPAGLAMAGCLSKKGISYLVIEQSSTIAPKWHNHYKRLHLHTAKEFSHLPYMKFPKQFPRYPSRQQVVRYLEDYAKHFNIKPQYNTTVTDTTKNKKSWTVSAEQEGETLTFTCKNLIVATGFNHIPHRPTWDGFEQFSGDVVHSAEYQDGQAYKDKTVMVVGFGNSGAEIALDLWEYSAKPIMSVRSAVNVLPKEILGVPTLAMGIVNQHLPAKMADTLTQATAKRVIGDLSQYGLRTLERGPMQEIQENMRVPMLDVGTIDLIKKGEIIVYPDIEKFDGDTVRFTDGKKQKVDAVVLATGYRPAISQFIHNDICLTEGLPNTSGRKSEVKDLYFIGFYVSPAGMLREVATEAKRITKLIT